MKTHRATLHMALAAYMAPDENEQVLKIARRVYLIERKAPSFSYGDISDYCII
jgi:hypothetical protein